MAYKDGTDLILSLNGVAMGYASSCKISDSAETGERVTKEKGSGKFKETYVKSVSEQITCDGFEATDSRTTYSYLKDLMLTGTPVTLTYCHVDETQGYQGTFIITQLDLDGPAGDDEKYSLTFANSGAVKKATVTAQTREGVTVASTSDITAPAAAPGKAPAAPQDS